MTKKKTTKKDTGKKRSIMKVYGDLSKKLKRRITFNDMVDAGVTKDMVKHHFGSLSRLENAVRQSAPGKFRDVDLQSIINPKSMAKLDGNIKKYNRFFITSAVTGCLADVGFLNSIKTFCDKNNAHMLVLVASDPASNFPTKQNRSSLGSVDKKILEYGDIVTEDTQLNSNVHLSTIKLSAKQIDPITGLQRLGQRNGSFIYASPKQRMKPVAVSNNKLPHVLMTTGACTKSSYTSSNYMSKRTSVLAENDHVIGGLIVEIVDDKEFHYRQVQADSKGNFIDLGIQYKSNGVTSKVTPEAFVLGDWHSGWTDPDAKAAWFDVCKLTSPKRIVIHDGMDAFSISHHHLKDAALMAYKSTSGLNSLKKEVERYAEDLEDLSSRCDEVVLVKSNHDQHLDGYLKEARYAKDPANHRYSLSLAMALMDGKDPLKYAVEQTNILTDPGKVRWLNMDEDFIVAGIQCGAHGHKGANGARGSINSIENAYGQSVTGHAHTPQILRGAWVVGTSSLLQLQYNSGPSSWMHSSCLIYPNGSRQLINSIFGRWRSDTDSMV